MSTFFHPLHSLNFVRRCFIETVSLRYLTNTLFSVSLDICFFSSFIYLQMCRQCRRVFCSCLFVNLHPPPPLCFMSLMFCQVFQSSEWTRDKRKTILLPWRKRGVFKMLKATAERQRDKLDLFEGFLGVGAHWPRHFHSHPLKKNTWAKRGRTLTSSHPKLLASLPPPPKTQQLLVVHRPLLAESQTVCLWRTADETRRHKSEGGALKHGYYLQDPPHSLNPAAPLQWRRLVILAKDGAGCCRGTAV